MFTKNFRMMGRVGVAVCLSIAILLVFSTGQKATAGEKVKLAIGSGAIYSAPTNLAVKSGFFQKEGLDVQAFVTNGGAKAAAAVISGQCHFGAHSFSHVIKAQNKGEKLKGIALTMNNPGYFLTLRPEVIEKAGIRAELPLKEIYARMKGLTIGVTSMGSGTYLALVWMARQGGLDPVKDIKIVPTGKPAARIAAMEKKTIDGLLAGSHTAETVEYLGTGKNVLYTADIPELQGFLGAGISAHEDYLKSNSKTARKFVRAIGKAMRMMKNNPEKTLAMAKKNWPKIPVPVLTQAIENRMRIAPMDLKMSEEGARTNMQWLIEAGKLDKMLPPEQLFTNEFVD